LSSKSNFYLDALASDKMADFLPSAKNANFYLDALASDKMADFRAVENAIFTYLEVRDSINEGSVETKEP
jgi:hypothetical protein